MKEKTNVSKRNKILLIVGIVIGLICGIIIGPNAISKTGRTLIKGEWYDIDGCQLKFAGIYWQYFMDNVDNPPDYYWNSSKCPFYVIAGDKIVAFGMGVEIIDIEEISKERIVLKNGERVEEFTNKNVKKSMKGLSDEDKKILELFKREEWKSVYGRMTFMAHEYQLSTYCFLDDFGGTNHYYYDYIGDGIIEVRYGDTIERLTIKSIDEDKMVMNVRGEELEFEHRVDGGFYYAEHLCLCDDCKSVLYSDDDKYDEVRGIYYVDADKMLVESGESYCHEDYGPLSKDMTQALLTEDTKVYVIERDNNGKCICKEVSVAHMAETINENGIITTACFWLDPEDKSRALKIVFPRIRK